MDFGTDTIVVKWKANTKELEGAMDKLREKSERTRKAVTGTGGPGAGSDASEGAALRRRWANQHALTAATRAERNMVYELAKAQRYLKGEALKTFHDQVAAAKKLHAERIKEARSLTDIKQKDLSLIDANRKLAQSYREIASDARKASEDVRRSTGPGWAAKFTQTFFKVVSWLRAVRYVGWVIMDALRTVGNAVQAVINAFVTLMRTWVNVVSTALKFGAAVGVAVVGALVLATKQAIDFESAMARVGGVLSKQLDQMPQLEKAIRAVAKAYGMSADEASQAAFQLASYGYGQKQTAAMLPGTALLARSAAAETGGAPDMNRAAEAIGRVLLVWRKDGKEAVAVANTLAAANAYSAATFERLYTAMPKASQAANLVNMSFEETVATLSQLNNAGLDASQAGAALLGLIVRLLAPTKEWRDTVESHGVAYNTVNPAVVGFRKALQNLVALGLNPMEIATFRNRNGLLALNILTQQGSAEHDRMTRAVTGTRKAEEQSAIMLDTVGAKWQRLKAGVRDFAITLTEKVRPALKWLLDRLAGWVNWLASTPQVKALANALAGLAWGFADLAVRLLGMVDIRKNWGQFVQSIVGYMKIATKVIVVGVGVIEYAFRSIADPNSPLRLLWSSFWEFVAWSVKQGGGLVVGGVAAIRKVLENFQKDGNEYTRRWGNTFVAIIAETMKQATALMLDGLAEMADAMAEWHNKHWYMPGAAGYVALSKELAYRERAAAETIRKSSGTKMARNLLNAGSAIARAGRGAVQGSPLMEGVGGAFSKARNAFLSGEMQLPLANMVSTHLNALIEQWSKTAAELRQRGDAAAQVFEEASAKIGKFAHEIEELGDETEGTTTATEKYGDRVEGLISKVIGAPLEAIQKFISPVSFGRMVGAGGLGGLLGLNRANPMQLAAQMQLQAANTQMQAAQMQMGAVSGGGGGVGAGAVGGGGGTQPNGYWRPARYRTEPTQMAPGWRLEWWAMQNPPEQLSLAQAQDWVRQHPGKTLNDLENLRREAQHRYQMTREARDESEERRGLGGRSWGSAEAKARAHEAVRQKYAKRRALLEKASGFHWGPAYEEYTQQTGGAQVLVDPGGWTPNFSASAVGGGAASSRASLLASPGKYGQRLRDAMSRGMGLPSGLPMLPSAPGGGIASQMGLPGGPGRASDIYITQKIEWPNGMVEQMTFKNSQLVERKIIAATQQLMPALQGY